MPDPLFDLAARTEATIRAAGKAPFGSADRLLWAAFNLRSARIGQRIITLLAASPSGYSALSAQLDAEWDVLEVAAMSLAFEDSMTALDICANALYEAVGGTAPPSGIFRDVGYWSTVRIAALSKPTTKAWITALTSSADYADLKLARDALTHRYVSRQMFRGGTRSVSSIATPGRSLGSLDVLIPRTILFAEQEFESFCGALAKDFG
jgi:hypothetical protein